MAGLVAITGCLLACTRGQTLATPRPPVQSPTGTGPSPYPVHRGITATVFWIGEPKGNGSSENNAVSAFDDGWQAHYGGYDDYAHRAGYYPAGFVPNENPFYLDLPYSDFTDGGARKQNIDRVYWYDAATLQPDQSIVKNRWVRVSRNGVVCYGQWEDAGPYQYDDVDYVFGTVAPKNREANHAGMDVSPAMRDCLRFDGLNNADNTVDWQFVDERDVPDGPWRQIVTTSPVYRR